MKVGEWEGKTTEYAVQIERFNTVLGELFFHRLVQAAANLAQKECLLTGKSTSVAVIKSHNIYFLS